MCMKDSTSLIQPLSFALLDSVSPGQAEQTLSYVLLVNLDVAIVRS